MLSDGDQVTSFCFTVYKVGSQQLIWMTSFHVAQGRQAFLCRVEECGNVHPALCPGPGHAEHQQPLSLGAGKGAGAVCAHRAKATCQA